MIGFLILVFLYTLFAVYWFFFTKITLSIAYNVYGKKQKSETMDSSNRVFNLYKIISYVSYVLVLIVIISLSKYANIKIAMHILNWTWILGLGMIKVNISLIDHLINVLFIPHGLKTIEKDFIIGAIEYNSGLKFKYRLRREVFNI